MSTTEGAGGGDKSSSIGPGSSATVGGPGKAIASVAGGGGPQLSATAVIAGTATTAIPIDLASASKVLVRPEKTTMPTTTYRFGSNAGSQMRVVIPSSAAPQTFYRQPANIKQDTTTNRTQISAIPAARTVTQTTSLTVSRAPQTTPTTVSYHVSNRVSATPVVAANLQATARATTINGPIRISTPPIQVATNNSTTTYVQRQPPTVVPTRNVTVSAASTVASAPATAATIISQNSGQTTGGTTTLVPNFQMSTQLIRANSIATATGASVAGVPPRARVVTQTALPANHHQQVSVNSSSGVGGAGSGTTAVVSSLSGGVATVAAAGGGAPQTIAISGGAGGAVGGGTVTGSTGSASGQTNQPQQAFVATLSAVLQAPRQVSTLVYTNNSNAQQYTIGPNQQRLALATTLSPQRPPQAATVTTGIRPTIQRLPTTAAGIRVSNGSLNFRPPVLASTTVLTTIASGGAGTVGTVTNSQAQQQQAQQQQQQRTVTGTGGATGISNSIPARIIQVQNPQSGAAGTAQIVNGRIQTNLLNIQPLIVSNNRLQPQNALQPGLTIAQVGKLTPVSATGGVVAGLGTTGPGGGGPSGGGASSGIDGSIGGGGTTTLQTASGQQIVVSTGGVGGAASSAILASGLIAANQSGVSQQQSTAGGHTTTGQITQIVNVNAPTTVVSVAGGASGPQQQQQIVTVSQAGGAGSGGGSGVSATGTTVIPIPLALTSARSGGGAVGAGHSPLSIVTGGIMRTASAGGPGMATSLSSVLPIAKVTPQQQQTLVSIESSGGSATTQHYTVAGGPGSSLYIQTRPQPGGAVGATGTIITAPTGGGTTGAGGAKAGGNTAGGTTLSVVASSSAASGGGGGTSGGAATSATTTFLPTSTFYYERLTSSPATSISSSSSSSVPSSNASGGVASSSAASSLAASSSTVTFVHSSASSAAAAAASSSTITTTSAISGPVFSIPSSSSVISSGGSGGSTTTVLTVAGGTGASGNASLTPYGSSGSFAIVQASAASLPPASSVSARTAATLSSSGPIHGIVPASSIHQGSNSSSATITGSIVSVSQQSAQAGGPVGAPGTTQIVPIRFHPQLIVDSSGQTQQIIVSSGGSGGTANIVPLIPVGGGLNRNNNNTTTATVVTTATKTQQQQHQQHQQQQQHQQHQQHSLQESPQSSILRKRALVESVSLKTTPVVKDLTQALMVVEREREQQEALLLQHQQQQLQQHAHLVATELRDLAGSPAVVVSHSRPPSTDGSTTVSATSSPGLDEQEEEELRAQAYENRNSNAQSGDGHFKPVQGELHYLQQQQQHQREIMSLHCTESFPTNLGTSTTLTVVPISASHAALSSGAGSSSSSSKNGDYEQSPRKKARKQLHLPMSESGGAMLKPGSVVISSSSSVAGHQQAAAAAAITTATTTTALYLPEQHHHHQHHHLVEGATATVTKTADERMDTSGSGIVVLGTLPSAASSSTTVGVSVSQTTVSGGGIVPTVNKQHSSINVSVGSSLMAGPANSTINTAGVTTTATTPMQQNNASARMDPPAISSSSSTTQPAGTAVQAAPKTQVASLRKPNNVSLLQSYKQTWKAANNHFQRYTDVKQREERRPTVMDIANQSHILQKVNGWKIYHLSAQIEDMCALESQAYGKLGKMLRAMESSGSNSGASAAGASGSSNSSNSNSVKPSTDIERINELLKGNMQRSKIIMDGINEARTQIMKIFKHKPHVSDILLRCASKRNFKKREKT